MSGIFALLSLALFFFGFSSNAAAAPPDTPPRGACITQAPPTKTVIIQNNSTDTTIYPVIQVPIYSNQPVSGSLPIPADLWMQAQCGITNQESFTRTFPTSTVKRAYINIPLGMNNPQLNDPGINESVNGVPPGATVTITVPFYTKMTSDVSLVNFGNVNDQFTDWWNSMRVYLFYGKAQFYSAFWEAGLKGQPSRLNLPDPSVAGQIVPTCTLKLTSGSTACTVNFEQYTVNPLDQVPFQLQEYTFASAEGPPPAGSANEFKIDTKWVNYNVSSLDSVYLPVAMGPILTKGVDPCDGGTCSTEYLGDAANVSDFNTLVAQFTNGCAVCGIHLNAGAQWPNFVPIYFAAPSYMINPLQFPPKILTNPPNPSCSLGSQPFPGATPPPSPPITPYMLPKIPGTFNAILYEYNNSYSGLTQAPPAITGQPSDLSEWPNYNVGRCDGVTTPTTSDPLTSTPGLGTAGKAFVQLWNDCTSGKKTNQWCDRIKYVNQFFKDNWAQQTSCPQGNLDQQSLLAAVYGWVPITAPLFPGGSASPCIGNKALLATTQSVPPNLPSPAYYNMAQRKYCELQYNYLQPDVQADPTLVFNPYTRFIHGNASVGVPDGVGSTAYAFSIDDELAFRHLVSSGVIITIGGTAGLDDTSPSPVPTLGTFSHFCRGGGELQTDTHHP